jgi:hypothetical protein
MMVFSIYSGLIYALFQSPFRIKQWHKWPFN